MSKLKNSLLEMVERMDEEEIVWMVKQLKKHNLITSDKNNNLVYIWMPRKNISKNFISLT